MTVLVDNKCILQYARSLVSWKLWHHVKVRLHHQSFGVLCQVPLVDRLWAVDEQPTNLARGFSFCLGFSPGLSHPNRVIFLFVLIFDPDTLGPSKRGLELYWSPAQKEQPALAAFQTLVWLNKRKQFQIFEYFLVESCRHYSPANIVAKYDLCLSEFVL